MKMQGQKVKCKDDIKSYFLDRFEQVERSKKQKKQFDKAYDGHFNDEIYKIVDVKLNLPIPLYEHATMY